jgi:hypothetical protein
MCLPQRRDDPDRDCTLKISELAKDDPALRRQHLLDLHKAADDRGDSACSIIILEILTREHERKKWRWINYTT